MQVLPDLDSLELASCVLREAPLMVKAQLKDNQHDSQVVSSATCAEFPEIYQSHSLAVDFKHYSTDATLAALGVCVRYGYCTTDVPKVTAVAIKNFNVGYIDSGNPKTSIREDDSISQALDKMPSVKLQSITTGLARIHLFVDSLESNKKLHTRSIDGFVYTGSPGTTPGSVPEATPTSVYKMLQRHKPRQKSLSLRGMKHDATNVKCLVSGLPKLTCLTHLDLDATACEATSLDFVLKLTKLKRLFLPYSVVCRDPRLQSVHMSAIARLSELSSLCLERHYHSEAGDGHIPTTVYGMDPEDDDPRHPPAVIFCAHGAIPSEPLGLRLGRECRHHKHDRSNVHLG